LYTSNMAKRVEDSLWFPEKLGRRLVELRRQRGLTQGRVAELMGRAGKWSKTYVCRLERGRFRSPSLRLVGDYLRACGAGFEDVLDVLHEYTRRPSVPDEQGWVHVEQAIQGLPSKVAGQAIKYDFKTTQARRKAGKLPEEPRLRVEHDLNWARKQAWLRRLHVCVVQVVNEHGFDLGGEFRGIWLQWHARKVWGILGRTRGKPEERARLIAEAEEKFLRQDMVAAEVVRVVDEAVVALSRQVEEHGPG
jgi:transcriptional regulator with XRE-family HTH domain